MRKHYLGISVAISLLFSACSEDQNVNYEANESLKTESFNVRDRSPDFPLNIEEFNNSGIQIRSDIDFNYKFLGQGFKPLTLPLIDPINFSFPILDVDKIISDSKKNPELDIKTSMQIKSWLPDISTFTSFDTYAQSKSVTKVVKGGFSLTNIPIVGKLFGFGSRKKYKEVFNSLMIDTTMCVYGELQMAYRDSLHKINTGDAINKDLTHYYTNRFKKDLYSTHMTDLLKSYGYFLVSSVETGGIMTALYQGNFISHEDFNYRSKTMYDSINLTFTYKEITGNMNFAIHKNKENWTSQLKKYSSINMSFRTFGGDISFEKFTPPVNIQNLSEINFGNWIESLKDKKNLVVSQIAEEGLVPLYDFLYEENLKEQAKRYATTNIANDKKSLIEPYLYLESLGNTDMRNASLYFVTKYGDYIRLGLCQLPGLPVNNANMKAVFDQMIGNEKNFFPNLKVVAKHYYSNSDMPPKKEFEYKTNTYYPSNPDYKYVRCKENENIYMISKTNKVGYTLALDHVWTQYGLKKPDNIASLSEISLHELLGYKIFAL